MNVVTLSMCECGHVIYVWMWSRYLYVNVVTLSTLHYKGGYSHVFIYCPSIIYIICIQRTSWQYCFSVKYCLFCTYTLYRFNLVIKLILGAIYTCIDKSCLSLRIVNVTNLLYFTYFYIWYCNFHCVNTKLAILHCYKIVAM